MTIGARGETRTRTSLRKTDFKSVASTNSATRAGLLTCHLECLYRLISLIRHTDIANRAGQVMQDLTGANLAREVDRTFVEQIVETDRQG